MGSRPRVRDEAANPRVTPGRTKPEFVSFVRELPKRAYASARRCNVVLDNLNTRFASTFESEDVPGASLAHRLSRRVQFHWRWLAPTVQREPNAGRCASLNIVSPKAMGFERSRERTLRCSNNATAARQHPLVLRSGGWLPC